MSLFDRKQMNISDPTISNLRSAASTNDPKKLYNVLVELPRSDRYRCLYSLDSQGMNLLEWAIHNDYWNTANLLVYFAWVGVDFQLRKYSDQNPCVVPSVYWNQIFCHTICLLHSTSHVRDPKVRNEQLPLELQQRLNFYRKAQEKGCFGIANDYGNELAFILLVRIGADVPLKNSQNESTLAQLLKERLSYRYIPSLKFIVELHPLIGYTERDKNNTCLLIYCLENGKGEEFSVLRTKEAFEKLEKDRLLIPYIATRAFANVLTEEERARVLLSLNEEELDLNLSSAIKDNYMSRSLIMAVEKALKKDYRFTTTLAIDNLHTLNPFIGAYFLQHHLGEDAASLKVLRQQWKRDSAKTRFSERPKFPIDQLPTELLLLIARYLRADDVLALLLTTKSINQILAHGSALWQQYFLAKQMQFKPDSTRNDWKSTLLTSARTHVSWRAGRLVEKRDFVRNSLAVHKQWVLLNQANRLVATHWHEEFDPIGGQFAPLNGLTYPLVLDSTHDSVTALVLRSPPGYNIPLQIEIGVLGSAEPTRCMTLPTNDFIPSIRFARDKSHFVFGPNLNVVDLQTEQVVGKLDFTVSNAESNYFNPSTILACPSLYQDPKILLLDDALQTVCTMEVPAQLTNFHMVNEHHVLCVLKHSLCYFDIRYPAQSIPMINTTEGSSLALDIFNQRMTLCSVPHASIMTFDLNTMLWDRVLLAPEAIQGTYYHSYLYDKYFVATRTRKVYEMVL